MPEPGLQLLLVVIALLAGVGITAIGPGGIFLTIALYSLLPIPPPVIAGTASATFIAAGLVGTATYLRSGELAARESRGLAGWLAASSVVGALAGTLINPLLPKDVFGALLGLAAIATGALIVVQRVRGLRPRGSFRPESGAGRAGVAGLGLAIGVSGSVLGVGGPVLAVPALVLLGVPMLTAVAVAQVQSVFVSAFATLGYAVQGAVSWPLAVLVGVPQLVGVVAGWWVAQRTDPDRLKVVLGCVLMGIGVYLLL